MRIRVPAWLAGVCLVTVLAIGSPAVVDGQAPDATGWTYETIRSVANASCSAVVRFAGFAFDPAGRAVAGWSDNATSCFSDYRWTRKENGSWNERTLTQPGCCGGNRGYPDLKVRADGTPFYAFAYPSAWIFGGEWHSTHILNLETTPHGPGGGWQAIDSYRSCLASFPKFAIDFAPGATDPNWMVGTSCLFTGWLTLNGAAVHGQPPFQSLVGVNGEYHSLGYATAPDGSHHSTFYTERGGTDWGCYYSNGTPGHQVFLAQPHRNRGAETSVAVDRDGRIHVALGGIPLCGNTFEGGLLYLTSSDGVTWSRTFVDVQSGRGPQIAVDANGNPQIAYWRFGTQVRLASLRDGAWTTTPVFSGTNPVGLASVELTYDAGGRPNILFFNPDTNEIQIASGGSTNAAPVIVPTGAQSSAPGANVSIEIVASDAEADALTFSACGLPPGLAIDPATGEISGTVSATEVPGTSHTVTLSVSDAGGQTSTITFTWTIATNAAPAIIVPADQASEEGQAASVTVGGSDADNDALTFTASGLPAGLAIDPATGVISGTLAAGSAGSYTVSVSVTDGEDSASGSFTWTVTAPPPPPPANASPVCDAARPTTALLWPPNHKQVHVVGILGVTDADGDTLGITITGILQDEPTDTTGDGSTAIDGFGVGTSEAGVRAERTGTPKVPGDGRIYEILFTASDGRGGSCMGMVTVGVPHDLGARRVPVDSVVRYDSTTGARVR